MTQAPKDSHVDNNYKDMPKICQRYPKYMPNIHQIYARDLSKIDQRYAKDMPNIY